MDTPSARAPIGLFDSGIGGLSVLAELQKLLPNESYLYLADSAHFPYGTKSAPEICRYSLENGRFLVARGVKLLVISCHTASIHALELLQRKLPIPVIGMLDSTLQSFSQLPAPQRIAFLATTSTLSSQRYQTLLQKTWPKLDFIPLACPQLVTLAEEYAYRGFPANADEIIQYTLAQIPLADHYFLGCTHFPMLKPLMPSLSLIDPAEACAKQVRIQLTNLNQLNSFTPVFLEMHSTDNRTETLHAAWKVVAKKT